MSDRAKAPPHDQLEREPTTSEEEVSYEEFMLDVWGYTNRSRRFRIPIYVITQDGVRLVVNPPHEVVNLDM